MVIVFVIIIPLAGLKQEITSYHLKDSTSQAPYVGWCIVVSTYYDFWGTILPGLNLWGKMVISPATISHITYLYHYIFINFGTSLTLTGLLLTSIGSCTCIIQLIIFVKKITNWFIYAIKTALLGMPCLFFLFSYNRLLFSWLLLFFILLILLCLLAFIVAAFLVCGILLCSFILLLLSL